MVPMVILKSILEKISGGCQDSQVLLYENSFIIFTLARLMKVSLTFKTTLNVVTLNFVGYALEDFYLSPSRKDFAYSNSLRMTSARTLNIPRTPRLTYY